HGGNRGISSEPDRRGWCQAAQQARRLDRAEREFGDADDLAHQARADAPGANAMEGDAGQLLAERFAAPVGRQRDLATAPQQFARQGFGREHVAPGAASRENDEAIGAHASVPPNRRRVSASAMPMPRPSDKSEEPP